MQWRIYSKRLQENLILVYLGPIMALCKVRFVVMNMAQSMNYSNLTPIKGVPYRISAKCLESFLGLRGYVNLRPYIKRILFETST